MGIRNVQLLLTIYTLQPRQMFLLQVQQVQLLHQVLKPLDFMCLQTQAAVHKAPVGEAFFYRLVLVTAYD